MKLYIYMYVSTLNKQFPVLVRLALVFGSYIYISIYLYIYIYIYIYI